MADVIGHPLGVAAAGVVVAVAVVAVVALWPGTTPKPRPSKHSTHPTVPAASVATLKPVRASGFDPLTSLRNDPYNENSRHAKYAIDQSAKTAWTSQWYKSAAFGGLKSGAGLLIRMPKAETYRSVIVTFGSVPGADVELLVGNSAARSAANLHSMKTVAAAHDVSGTVAFHITSSATGRVLVIWFTKLPPRPHTPWYMAEVYNVVVRGLS